MANEIQKQVNSLKNFNLGYPATQQERTRCIKRQNAILKSKLTINRKLENENFTRFNKRIRKS